MKHRVKVRAHSPDGTSEKISFDLEHGKSFPIRGDSPGFTLLGGEAGHLICQLEIDEGAIWVMAPENQLLSLNGMEGVKLQVRTGDQMRAGKGSLEFLDVPEVNSLPEEQGTRFVSLDEMQARPAPVFPAAPETMPAPAAQAPIQNFSVPAPERAHEPAVPVSDGATAMIMGEALASELSQITADSPTPAPFRTPKYIPSRSQSGASLWFGVALSAVLIAFSAELAALVAFGFKYKVSPLPIPVASITILALFGGIAFAVKRSAPRLGMSARFSDVFRAFSMGSPLLIAFAYSFAFPVSVVIFAALILICAWTTTMVVRFHPMETARFVGTVAGPLCAMLFGAFAVLPRIDLGPTDAQVEQQIAESEKAAEEIVARAPAAVAAVQPKPTAEPVKDQMAEEQYFNAVRGGDLETVRKFIEMHVVDANFTLHQGSTALHMAAAHGKLSVVKFLTSSKVRSNLDAQDPSGTTPLMWAVYRGHAEVAKYLVSKGANRAIRREGGDQAVDIARKYGLSDMVPLLDPSAKPRKPASSRSKKH